LVANSLAISGYGERIRCFLVPLVSGPATLSAAVTDARHSQCSPQDQQVRL
jgi:hypothetical protein